MKTDLHVLLLIIAITVVQAKQIDLYPTTSNWVSSLNGLNPGDTVVFHAGTYNIGGGYFGTTFKGSLNSPITIKGAAGDTVVINQNGANQNIWNIDGSNFGLYNLQFTGGSRGLRLGSSGNVSNAVFDTLKIHDTAATAFNANQGGMDFSNITIKNCEVYNTADTGECFYLGCADASCQIHNSIIENNLCHDTMKASGGSNGSGFQIKPGSYSVILRNNVCYNTKGVCCLFYDDFDRGANTIEGNVVFATGADNGIQVTSGAIIKNNIVISSAVYGIAISTNSLQSGKNVRNILVIHNTVIGAQAACLRLSNVAAGNNIIVANNALYCDGTSVVSTNSNLNGLVISKNAVTGDASALPASGYFAGSLSDLQNPSGNVYYPTSTATLIGKGDPAHSTPYDFNYKPRSTTAPTVGAYEYSSAQNPGWKVAQAINPTTHP